MKKLLLFVFLLTVFSCKDDDINELQNPTQETTEEASAAPLDFGTAVQADFMGRVVNDEGFRIYNATVTIGNQTVQTDANGVFSIQEATVFKNFALIKVTKDNYIQGSRALVPQEGGFNSIEITLLRKNIVETVNSGESSQVSYEGSNIFFPGEFEYPDGTPYNGQVDVSVHYLKPNVPQTFSAMPGMLLGEDANGNAQSMETYGMLAVNLFDQAGEELDIAEDFPATLEFPVDPGQAAIAPTEIPLWYFDEEMGYWKEEGTAQKQGNKYVGEVAHFTWWNCDLPLDYVTLCLNLIANEQALSGNYIELIRNETGQTIFYGTIDLNGSECGLIPANESITLNIYENSLVCLDQVIYQQIIGPYNTDASLTVTIPENNLSSTLIAGTILNCNSMPLEEGFGIIFDGNNDFALGPIPILNGELNYQFSYCEDLNYQIQFYDSNSSLTSELFSINTTNEEIQFGNILLCNEQSLVYDGFMVLESQEEVEIFGSLGYISITDGLHIEGQDISSLAALNTLEEIGGNLIIQFSPLIESLEGLDNLATVSGVLRIASLESITTLEPLNNINSNVLWLSIRDNISLENLNGLNNIGIVEGGSLYLVGNDSLIDVDGLQDALPNQMQNIQIDPRVVGCGLGCVITFIQPIENLSFLNSVETVESLSIQKFQGATLNGLQNIQAVDFLNIYDCPNINDLNILSNISGEILSLIIGDMDLVESLDGLENISLISNFLRIKENSSLIDLCALENSINTIPEDNFSISGNAFNPTQEDIIDGNCSQ